MLQYEPEKMHITNTQMRFDGLVNRHRDVDVTTDVDKVNLELNVRVNIFRRAILTYLIPSR